MAGMNRKRAAGLALAVISAALIAAAARGVRRFFPSAGNPIPELADAQGLMELGNPEGAMAAYSRAISAHPKNGLLYFYRGKACLSAGRLEEAAGDFTKSISLGYPETSSYLWRGMIKGRYKGDWPGQLQDSSKVLQTDTTNMEAYFLRAEARIKLGDYAGALKDYKSAIALEPGNALLYSERAALELLYGDYPAAETDAVAALRIDSSYSPAHAVLGSIHVKTGAVSAVERDYTLAITHNSKKPDYYSARASVRETLGDLKGAASDYESEITISSGSARTYYLLARACFRMSRHDRALAAIEKAVSILPAESAYYDLRARIRSELGYYSGAAKDWKTAAGLDASRAKMAKEHMRRLKKEKSRR